MHAGFDYADRSRSLNPCLVVQAKLKWCNRSILLITMACCTCSCARGASLALPPTAAAAAGALVTAVVADSPGVPWPDTAEALPTNITNSCPWAAGPVSLILVVLPLLPLVAALVAEKPS